MSLSQFPTDTAQASSAVIEKPNITIIHSLDDLVLPASRIASEPDYWYLCAFLVLFAWRYVRLIIHVGASYTYKPLIPKLSPAFSSKDCTVVLVTVDGNSPCFMQCVESILANNPFKLSIIVPFQNAPRVRMMLKGYAKVSVSGASRPNKRFQQVCGLKTVNTPITVFADDDVIWPSTFLHAALTIFEDPQVGAGGTGQRLVRRDKMNMWNFFGSVYLERRNFECAATSHINGSISTISGRTQLVRTGIIKNDTYMKAYLQEKWLGRIPLYNADDDKFVTRWLRTQGWKVKYQYCAEAELRTTLQSTFSGFLGQCVRWNRTVWRSAVTAMFFERSVWKAKRWSLYATHLKTFNPPALIMDSGLGYLLHKTVSMLGPAWMWIVMVLFVLWLMFTKTVKLIPHFYHYPCDLKYLPLHFAFGYFHGLVKIWTLLTLHRTSWSGRLTPVEHHGMWDELPTSDDKQPTDFVTPGVPRLVEGGAYEFPRVKDDSVLKLRTLRMPGDLTTG